jgi:hypothetical protein
MTVAVVLPRAGGLDVLLDVARAAEAAGADALVLAEPPLGDWASAPAAAASLAGHTPLPVGIAVNVAGRPPLAVWEEIGVLQRVVGPGLWTSLIGWSRDQLVPPAELTPPLLPFAAPAWLVCAGAAEVDEAAGLARPRLAPPGTMAEGAYGSGQDLLSTRSPGRMVSLLSVGASDALRDELEWVARLKAAALEPETWLRVATEGFEAPRRAS